LREGEHVVKRSRFTEEQIAYARKQAELGTKVDEICREMCISDATFYKWRQFTATEFTEVVLAQGCKLSMDGRGAWRDNVFVERLWRSVSAARADLADYIDWYKTHRPHASLDRATPERRRFAGLAQLKVAA
jgi:transposase InsO family protein